MSVDLNFWKYKEGVPHDNNKIYEQACCDGELVEELENLPIDEILEKIALVFSDWTALDKEHYEKEGINVGLSKENLVKEVYFELFIQLASKNPQIMVTTRQIRSILV